MFYVSRSLAVQRQQALLSSWPYCCDLVCGLDSSSVSIGLAYMIGCFPYPFIHCLLLAISALRVAGRLVLRRQQVGHGNTPASGC